MSREAMKMALEALESDPISHAGIVSRKQAIAALRQALETEQEPVAWRFRSGTWFNREVQWRYIDTLDGAEGLRGLQPLYTAPPKREWVGLKDEQVEDEWERITGHSIFGGDRSEGRAMFISPDEVIEFSRAIESKLKEKNGGEYRNGATTERTRLKEKNQ